MYIILFELRKNCSRLIYKCMSNVLLILRIGKYLIKKNTLKILFFEQAVCIYINI